MKPLDWHGLYSDSWGKSIVPEAYAHPAKYARGLIRAIYQHALEQKYLAPGDTVIDPFGGVALGAMDALRYGLHWTGVELEPRFVALGQANIDLWNAQFAHHFPGWGTARLLQGDSRQLCQVVNDAAAVVGSPPYINSVNSDKSGIDWDKAGRSDRLVTKSLGIQGANGHEMTYGNTDGQLGAMPEGQFAAAISSPPYANMTDKWNEGPGARFDPARHPNNHNKQSNDNGYGSTEGNLGNMGEGNGFAAAISSPPFEDSADFGYVTPGRVDFARANGIGNTEFVSPIDMEKVGLRNQEYGADPANIGNDKGETFWSAAALIVAQSYQILKPGGVSIWVCKDFVRNKKRVPFSDQWQALCEAVGFVPVERIRAWVIEHNGTQMGMFGEDKEYLIQRKSFFRLLAERKGSPRIDWEDVIILRKP